AEEEVHGAPEPRAREPALVLAEPRRAGRLAVLPDAAESALEVVRAAEARRAAEVVRALAAVEERVRARLSAAERRDHRPRADPRVRGRSARGGVGQVVGEDPSDEEVVELRQVGAALDRRVVNDEARGTGVGPRAHGAVAAGRLRLG